MHLQCLGFFLAQTSQRFGHLSIRSGSDPDTMANCFLPRSVNDCLSPALSIPALQLLAFGIRKAICLLAAQKPNSLWFQAIRLMQVADLTYCCNSAISAVRHRSRLSFLFCLKAYFLQFVERHVLHFRFASCLLCPILICKDLCVLDAFWSNAASEN